MQHMWDPIGIINTMLCVAILLLGLQGYKKNRDMVALSIGVAFGIFGISHIFALLGLQESLTSFLIIIRLLAYLLVALALYRMVVKGGAGK